MFASAFGPSAKDVATAFSADPELLARARQDPVAAVREIAGTPLATDIWIYRAVVVILGAIALLGGAGMVALSIFGKTAPEGLVALAAGAASAIGTLLVRPPEH